MWEFIRTSVYFHPINYMYIYIFLKNMNILTKNYKTIAFFITTLLIQAYTFNQSLCKTFAFEGVYYTLNTNYSNENRVKDNILFNYCNQIQYYCQFDHSIKRGSMIVRNDTGCYVFNQDSIQLLSIQNISKGIKVNYRRQQLNGTGQTISIEHQCKNQGDAGCPDVEQSTLFTFLRNRQLGFTITVQIIGIKFMTLGLYIYRATIVLLGACTMFFILLAIQVPIIFYPGVPSQFLSSLLILTGICSFFAGYVFGYFPKAGIFIQGCWIGLIISLTMNNVAFYFIKSNPANLTLWIVMPILCVLFGILSLFIKKTFIIFATSLIGAYMCLRALSWYLGAFPNQFLLARRYHLGLVGPVSWKFYLYVIALIILTASSSALQYWLFTKRSEITRYQDVDQQFGNMQAELKEKRKNMTSVQFDNFKQIFQRGKLKKEPKILRKTNKSNKKSNIDEQQDEQVDEIDQNDLDHLQSEPSEQRPAISKKQLNKRYIIK